MVGDGAVNVSDAIVFFFLFDPWVGRSKLSRTGVLEFHEVFFIFVVVVLCESRNRCETRGMEKRELFVVGGGGGGSN